MIRLVVMMYVRFPLSLELKTETATVNADRGSAPISEFPEVRPLAQREHAAAPARHPDGAASLINARDACDIRGHVRHAAEFHPS